METDKKKIGMRKKGKRDFPFSLNKILSKTDILFIHHSKPE